MDSAYQHLEVAPQAPQAPSTHAVGVTSYTEDRKEPVKLAAQWAPLGRVMKRNAETQLYRNDDAVNGSWSQTQISQRRKVVSETVTIKTKKQVLGESVLRFSGIARDPNVSTPDRDRSPQMAVSNRGFVPVALPYINDAKTLRPGTLAYFTQESAIRCHATLSGNGGQPVSANANPLSKTMDAVGTVLSCGERQHAMVHLHPLSKDSFLKFEKLLCKAGPDKMSVADRIKNATAVGATYRTFATDQKHMIPINLRFAAGGSTVGGGDMPTKSNKGAAWTKRAAFTTTTAPVLPKPSGGAPAPPAVVVASPSKLASKPKTKGARRKTSSKK